MALGDKDNPLMVLRGHVHDLRYSWQGELEQHKRVIERWSGNTPMDTRKNYLSYFKDDFITAWDDEVARKVTTFRDMVNFIEDLKDALDRDYQEFKKGLPEYTFDELKVC